MMSSSGSIEDMRKKILRDAEEEAKEVVSEAKKKALEIVKQVRADMENRGKEEQKKAVERMQKNRRDRIAEERAESHRRIQSFKSEILDEASDEALQRLRKYCDSDRYPETLRNFIVEAGVALGGGDLIVSMNERDRKLATEEFIEKTVEDIEEKTETKARLKLTEHLIKCVGGAIISKADESATINNTIEERLKKVREQATGELETILIR